MPVTKPVKKSNKKPVIKKTQDMQQTIEQTDAAIRENFYNMEEGSDYVLNDFWFAELNRVRKDCNLASIQKRDEYKLLRRGQKLFVNGCHVFDFTGKSNFTFAFALTFAFFAVFFSTALQHNGIEKLNKDTCDGKLVEIDGKKYKLTAV